MPNVCDRGRRVGGLLRYLYGAGKKEEHKDPHLVAAWDGAGELADLEPILTASGRQDFRHLVDLLEIPVRAGRNLPRLPVWHCSVRAHPTDPLLSDAQWAHIAAEILHHVGIARYGDEKAVRWVAVRHADDHIHVVATLVRQDRRTVWLRYDKRRSQEACRVIEDRHNLYRVGKPGQGTRAWPTSGEVNKAARLGRNIPPREELRRLVRAAATVAVDEEDFITRLSSSGILVRLRSSSRNPNEITGYCVALPADTTAAGQPIFYGGAKLAADLSLPRLRTRWGADTSLASARRGAARLNPVPAGVYKQVASMLTDAAARIRSAVADPAMVARIASAAADVLAAAAAAWEGRLGGPLTTAAELFDRATHETSRPAPARRGEFGYPLRAMARLVTVMGELSGDQTAAEALRLVYALAAFVQTLAELREALGRLHQAQTARAAATLLRDYTPRADHTSTAVREATASQLRWPDPIQSRLTTDSRRGR